MKQTTKATLLSALLFPGLGQLAVLKRPKRGLAMLLPALAASCYLLYGLWQGTAMLMNEALRGTLSPDPAVIAARLAEASTIPGASMASWIVVICWIASLVDALFVKD